MDKKHKSALDIKKETVSTLSGKVARAKTIAFTKYHGLTVNQLGVLRQKVKEAGGEFLVAKNSLLKRALTSNQLPVTGDQFTGPIAAVFSYEDEIAPIKAVADTKKTLGTPQFAFGFFGTKSLDMAGLENLASIPGRDVLHGKVVGTLAAPIVGIVNVLAANIRNLAIIVGEIAKTKTQ